MGISSECWNEALGGGIDGGEEWPVGEWVDWYCCEDFVRLPSLKWLSNLIASETREFKSEGISLKANSSIKGFTKAFKNTPYKAVSFQQDTSARILKSTKKSITLLPPFQRVNSRLVTFSPWPWWPKTLLTSAINSFKDRDVRVSVHSSFSFVSVCPVMDWWPVEGVSCFLPSGSWHRLHRPWNLERDWADIENGWMDVLGGYFVLIILPYLLIFIPSLTPSFISYPFFFFLLSFAVIGCSSLLLPLFSVPFLPM